MAKLQFFKAEMQDGQDFPFADEGVRAGFPSPAQDYMDSSIDLNQALVTHPESTFLARVAGDSMIDADVREGDIVVVDKSQEVRDGDMAVCVLNGEFTLKYVVRTESGVVLRPANESYPPIQVGDGDVFEVWGVVTYVIHKVR